MTEPAITPELVAKHNLTPDEYAHAKLILGGREPSYTELGIFSVMWSEHCSYKNTRPLLKTFPTKSPKILVGAGEENAGIIDIGDGLAIAFKIESHNHPSAVEPFQGAATGVGGIVRDIFTMGARPVCAVNSLRFGPITNGSAEGKGRKGEKGNQSEDASASSSSPQPLFSSAPFPPDDKAEAPPAILNNRRLLAGVVSGIAHYGNCFGIPTIAGEVYFDKSYEGNPLVNAFCLGVLRHEQIARGAAKGIGNPVFYVGPATGRDGLAGAAFASQDLTDESSQQQRGAVQVGDPFMEKLVCEACLELLATGAVAGIQDMGAAGLTCSTCETAARAGTGIEIELDHVPQRAPNMSSYEIMLSESQERMLIIVHKGREAEVKRIFDKWDLPWSEVGFVTDTGRMVVKHGGKVVADIPAKKIADESPVYHREAREPEYLKEVRAFRLDGIADSQSPITDLKQLLAWPTIASKNWVYRQYDHMVRANTIVCPGSDAAVLRIKADSLPEMSAELAAKVSSQSNTILTNGINAEQIEDCLKELSDRNYQENLWMGKIPGQQSSFVEAVEVLFTDTGLRDELEKGTTGFSKDAESKLRELRKQLSKIPNNVGPEEEINDPAMPQIRSLAAEALALLKVYLAKATEGNAIPEKLIAMTVDCNGAYVYLDPYEGGKIAVAEACRNLACSGAVPLGVTDNLNMPSPLKPELFWQIKESVRGLAEACRAFNAPVTGGNCSLYNQNPAGPIDPTPTVAVVGVIEKIEHITTQWFKDEGDAIILLGEPVDTADPILGLGGSAYLQVLHGQKTGTPPRCDLEVATTLHTTLLGLIQTGDIKSAHDCSEGGLAVALAESCISQLVAKDTPRLIGATVNLTMPLTPSLSPSDGERVAGRPGEGLLRLDALLFGETQSRVVITTKAINATKVVERAKLLGVPAARIGTVGGDKLTVKTAAGEFSAPLTELHDAWWNAIARAMA